MAEGRLRGWRPRRRHCCRVGRPTCAHRAHGLLHPRDGDDAVDNEETDMKHAKLDQHRNQAQQREAVDDLGTLRRPRGKARKPQSRRDMVRLLEPLADTQSAGHAGRGWR